MRLLLVVEDDRDTRTTLAELLSQIGYSVCDASDGSRALEKLRSLRPDLVLLDYGLPAPRDGDAFLRAKAADAHTAAIPVIVVTGYELPSQLDGTVAVIKKPFDFNRVVAVIQRYVGPPQKPDANAAA